jgi:hypothetical protein
MQNKIGRKGDRTWPKLTAPPTKKQKKNKKTPTTKLEEKEIGPGKSLQHPLNPEP